MLLILFAVFVLLLAFAAVAPEGRPHMLWIDASPATPDDGRWLSEA